MRTGSIGLVVQHNKLYVAFQANDASNILYVAESSDGQTFTAHGIGDIKIGSAPALTVFNNRLYVAFHANDTSDILYVAESSDGQTFTGTRHRRHQDRERPPL
jgi:hypothetical protein